MAFPIFASPNTPAFVRFPPDHYVLIAKQAGCFTRKQQKLLDKTLSSWNLVMGTDDLGYIEAVDFHDDGTCLLNVGLASDSAREKAYFALKVLVFASGIFFDGGGYAKALTFREYMTKLYPDGDWEDDLDDMEGSV